MIGISRSRDAAVVPSAARGANRKRREGSLLLRQRAWLQDPQVERFQSEWWKTCKPLLEAEVHSKCAYCESPTRVVAHGDVEHFRPKSKYWWLAYCVDNHLFSCQICNEVFKGDLFPLAGAALAGPPVTAASTDAQLAALAGALAPDPIAIDSGTTLAAFLAQAAGEQPLLPDPLRQDPELLFVWHADDVQREVAIAARAAGGREREVAQAAIDVFGLNREELRRWRWSLCYQHLARYKALADLMADSASAAAALAIAVEAMRTMTAADQPYAAVARYYVLEVWGLGG